MGMTTGTLACAFVIAAVTTVTACGGDSAPSTPTTPTIPTPTVPGVLQVAGTYQIVQAAVSDTCGQTGAPIPVTGTVVHAAGAGTFTLSDTGGTNFSGAVERDGAFAATATLGSGGQVFSQRLEGRFAATGFTGALAVDVSPTNCRFTRNWTATKQGAPNIFP